MDIASILKESAKEAKEEEKEESEEALEIAKHEIIQEKNPGNSSIYDLESPSDIASRDLYDKLDVKDDVLSLLKDMKIEPKYDLDDDVDALLRMKQNRTSNVLDKDRKEEARLRRSARKAKDDEYLDRYHTDASNFSQSEPSRVSMMLEDIEDKSYYHTIKSAFVSPLQEELFRSMRVVKRNTNLEDTANTILRNHNNSNTSLKNKRCLCQSCGNCSASNVFDPNKGMGNIRPCVMNRHSTAFVEVTSKKYSAVEIERRAKQYQDIKTSVHRPLTASIIGLGSTPSIYSIYDNPEDGYDRILDLHTVKIDRETKKLHRTVVSGQRKEYEDMRASSHKLFSAAPKKPTAMEKRKDPTLRYSTYEDAKECYFHPRLKGSSNNTSNKKNRANQDEEEEMKANNKFTFASRQETKEKLRIGKIQDSIGKANYDARVDKKVCPQCKTKQTYEEFKEKRKKCPMCNQEYAAAVDWSKVGKKFYQSHKEYTYKVAEKKERLRHELDLDYKYVERIEIDPVTGKTYKYRDYSTHERKLSKRELMEFYYRTDELVKLREEHLKKLDQKISKEVYPFKPSIKAYKKQRDDEDEFGGDDDESDDDPVAAFEKRYYEDLDMRREKFPMKYLKPKVDIDDLEPFRAGGGCTSGCKCKKCFGHLDSTYIESMNKSYSSSKFEKSRSGYYSS